MSDDTSVNRAGTTTAIFTALGAGGVLSLATALHERNVSKSSESLPWIAGAVDPWSFAVVMSDRHAAAVMFFIGVIAGVFAFYSTSMTSRYAFLARLTGLLATFAACTYFFGGAKWWAFAIGAIATVPSLVVGKYLTAQERADQKTLSELRVESLEIEQSLMVYKTLQRYAKFTKGDAPAATEADQELLGRKEEIKKQVAKVDNHAKNRWLTDGAYFLLILVWVVPALTMVIVVANDDDLAAPHVCLALQSADDNTWATRPVSWLNADGAGTEVLDDQNRMRVVLQSDIKGVRPVDDQTEQC